MTTLKAAIQDAARRYLALRRELEELDGHDCMDSLIDVPRGCWKNCTDCAREQEIKIELSALIEMFAMDWAEQASRALTSPGASAGSPETDAAGVGSGLPAFSDLLYDILRGGRA